jgi:predicted SnoaL-like aldol condensation-catalyzing enzyme
MTNYKNPFRVIIFFLATLILVGCSQEEASMPEQASTEMAAEEAADMAMDMAADMAAEEHGVMTVAEQTNLARAEEWWRTVLMGGRLDQAEEYMTERYIQHNPDVSTGRDGFIEFFSRFAQPGPIPEDFPPTDVKFAKGDYVVFVWEREAEDPTTGEPYNYSFFDVLRMVDGRVDEHWDSVFRATPPPGAPVMAIAPGIGPRPVAPANTAMEQAVEDLVNIEMKDILQYQNVDLAMEVMAEDYIQHNPNVPDGRDGFIEFFSRFANPQPIQDEWLDEPELILTHGDIALYIMTRYSEDPARDNEVYKWNWFDMFRVENGLIQEHWDSATRDNNVPPSVEPPEGFVSFSN